MIFAKLAVVAAACGTLASAWTTVTAEPPTATTVQQCNNDDLQASCCNDAGTGISPLVAPILDTLGIVLDDPTVLVGIDCSVLNAGGNCNANSLCCANNNFQSTNQIGIACSNVNLL